MSIAMVAFWVSPPAETFIFILACRAARSGTGLVRSMVIEPPPVVCRYSSSAPCAPSIV